MSTTYPIVCYAVAEDAQRHRFEVERVTADLVCTACGSTDLDLDETKMGKTAGFSRGETVTYIGSPHGVEDAQVEEVLDGDQYVIRFHNSEDTQTVSGYDLRKAAPKMGEHGWGSWMSASLKTAGLDQVFESLLKTASPDYEDMGYSEWASSEFEHDHRSTTVDGVAVHTFSSTAQAYNESQVSDTIKDGDILLVPSEHVVGVFVGAWPVAVSQAHGEFHQMNPDFSLEEIEGGKYAHAAQVAATLARTARRIAFNDPEMGEVRDTSSVSQKASCSTCLTDHVVTVVDPAQPLPACPNCGQATLTVGGGTLTQDAVVAKVASADDYNQGYALGTRHRERGMDYFLPPLKHIDFVRGYQHGYDGEPKESQHEGRFWNRQPHDPTSGDDRANALRQERDAENAADREELERHEEYWAEHPGEHERHMIQNASRRLTASDEGEIMPPGSVRITQRPDKGDRIDVVQVYGPTTSQTVWQGYDHTTALSEANEAIEYAKNHWPAECKDARVYDHMRTGSLAEEIARQFEDENPASTEGCDVCGDSGHTTSQHKVDPAKYDDATRISARTAAGGEYWQVKGPVGQEWGKWHESQEEAQAELDALRERYRQPGSGLRNLMPSPEHFTVEKVAVARRTAAEAMSRDDLVILTRWMADENYPGSEIARAVEKPWNYTSELAQAKKALREGSLHRRVRAKVNQIADGVQATNSGMSRQAALEVAVKTIRAYPEMITVEGN